MSNGFNFNQGIEIQYLPSQPVGHKPVGWEVLNRIKFSKNKPVEFSTAYT